MASGTTVRGRLVQPPITRDAIIAMLDARPRRYRIADKPPLRPPSQPGGDYRLNFRFRETFQNLVRACPVPFKTVRDGFNDEIYAYLDCDPLEIPQVEAWLSTLAGFVVCRDLLAVSLALDYDRENGEPGLPQTAIAQLRKAAKPYDRPPTAACHEAALQIADRMADAIRHVAVYDEAEIVVPMPPSSPAKAYDLPYVLARLLAERLCREDGSAVVRTTRQRPQAKNLTVDQKLDALAGTFEIDAAAVRDRTVLLLDDLYQSGASMNFVGMRLQDAGARAILGIAAEKTCRNDDNATRP